MDISSLQKKMEGAWGFAREVFSCSRVGRLNRGVSGEHREFMVRISIIRAPFSLDFALANALAFGRRPGGEICRRPSDSSLETRACRAGS